jgi:hypothetical protein
VREPRTRGRRRGRLAPMLMLAALLVACSGELQRNAGQDGAAVPDAGVAVDGALAVDGAVDLASSDSLVLHSADSLRVHDSGPASNHPSGLPWISGVSPGTGDGATALSKVAGFGQWRGRPVDLAAVFIGKNSWQVSYQSFSTNLVLAPTGAVAMLLDKGIVPLLTVPLVIKADAGKFALVAGGGRDTEHQTIAQTIKSVVKGRLIYLRLGHEADEGYPWSYTGHDGAAPDPAVPKDYRDAWARIAQIYKKAIPSAKMVWNVLKNTRQKITDYYPGDAVVDVLSVDVYDNGHGGYCDSATSPGWVKYCKGAFDPTTGVSKGVAGLLAFAKTRGKTIGVDEWGATNDDLSPTNGANNSFFVQGMYDFFAANAAYIEYESYFNRAGGGRHQIWPPTSYNPLPSQSYLQRYSPKP